MAENVLHENSRGGNCYKIKLTAALLGVRPETRQYDMMKGETRTPAFLARVNACGRIPVLDTRRHRSLRLHVAEDGGFRLRDHSHARDWLGRVAAPPDYVAME